MYIKIHLEDLMVRGPEQGYFPDTTKIIFFILEWNFQWDKIFPQGGDKGGYRESLPGRIYRGIEGSVNVVQGEGA